MSKLFREKLADLCHQQWSGWMTYLFSKGTFNSDGTWTMPAWAVKRWTRQLLTSYENLSEEEKNSDRREADKYLVEVQKHYKMVDEKDVIRIRIRSSEEPSIMPFKPPKTATDIYERKGPLPIITF